jgi:hypothetical protein
MWSRIVRGSALNFIGNMLEFIIRILYRYLEPEVCAIRSSIPPLTVLGNISRRAKFAR